MLIQLQGIQQVLKGKRLIVKKYLCSASILVKSISEDTSYIEQATFQEISTVYSLRPLVWLFLVPVIC